MSDTMDTDQLEAEQAVIEPVKDVKPVVRNVGKRLKQAREAKKMTTAEVAEQLRFTPSRVTYLENDDFERFPAATYTKGYVRAYAKLLGLPIDEIMAELENYTLEREVVHRHPELVVNYQTSTTDKSFRWVSYAIVLVLVVLLSLWWRNMHSDQTGLSAAIPLKSVKTSHVVIPSDVAMPSIEGSLDVEA